jgi:hypothetical protein
MDNLKRYLPKSRGLGHQEQVVTVTQRGRSLDIESGNFCAPQRPTQTQRNPRSREQFGIYCRSVAEPFEATSPAGFWFRVISAAAAAPKIFSKMIWSVHWGRSVAFNYRSH